MNQSARYIQSVYRHWRWGQAVKEVIQCVGKFKNTMVRQSGYNPPFDFHLQYVSGTPCWCCTMKNNDMFFKPKDEIVDYLIRTYLKAYGKHPLTYEALKIQRKWRKHNKVCGSIYSPGKEKDIQNWWRLQKIKNGAYFTCVPKAIGAGDDPPHLKHKLPQIDRTYQYQEGMVFHVKTPDEKCSFLIEQRWKLPTNLDNYIVKIR